MNRKWAWVGGFAFAVTHGATLHAQSAPAPSLDSLAACQKIADDRERLRCFDADVARLVAARDAGTAAIVDPKAIAARERGRFGLAPPRTPTVDRPRIARIDSTVRSAAEAEPGRWNIRLADGSVWQTVEPIGAPPRADAPVTVSAAALGGYRLQVGRGRVVLAKRLR